MSTNFKPMLAANAPADLTKLSWPLIAQAKLDGIRCSIVGGRALTRTLKEIPNREIYEALSRPEFEGLDGEIIVGSPTAKDAYRRTCSFVMAPSRTGGNPWCFHVFDKWDCARRYELRWHAAYAVVRNSSSMRMVYFSTPINPEELKKHEAFVIEQGYEGIILRDPSAPYKFGRSGKLGPLIKLKRFVDFEAEVVGCYEEMHNTNERKVNELGRGQRSSEKAGLVGKGRLGGFKVRALNGPWEGKEFKVGTGFDAEQRAEFWSWSIRTQRQGEFRLDERGMLIGRTCKVKAFDVGSKDLPRHPVFLGFRDMEVDG